MIPRKDSSRHAIYSLLSGCVGFWIDNWEIVPDFPRKPALWAGFLFPDLLLEAVLEPTLEPTLRHNDDSIAPL